jgi:arsenate reductase
VAAYIGAGYFFTSSTCFANPAITVGRVFSDSFAGIAPSSVPSFVAAQLLGGLAALALIVLLYGGMTTAQASDIVVAHDGDVSGTGAAADHPPGRSGAPS